jgi:hypothetical protein
MKYFLLLSALFFAGQMSAKDATNIQVFYCIHAETDCSVSGKPTLMAAEKIWRLAQRAMVAKDDFFGFVDNHDVTVQFMMEGPDVVLVDMPVPAQKGSYQTRVNHDTALALIKRMKAPLDSYKSTLQLKFAKWE